VAAKKGGQPRKRAVAKQREAVSPSVDPQLIKALAHPMRIRLLTVLNDRMASPNELSKELEEGLSQVSYHIKVLRDFECIEMVKTEPRRGAVEHYYKATSEVLISSEELKLVPKSMQHSAFSGVLADIEQDLSTSIEAGTFDKRPDCVVTRDPRVLDGQGRKDAERAAAEFFEKYRAIGAEAAQRLANGEDDGESGWTTAVVLVFGSAQGKKLKAKKKRGKS
jgi:DNA-binding transcriptional ArsR family regulator